MTSSITGGSYACRERLHARRAARRRHDGAGGTEGARLGRGERFTCGRRYYSNAWKQYGQNLRGGLRGARSLGPAVITRTIAPRTRCSSELNYKTRQFAFFGEGASTSPAASPLTAGLRYYNFKDDKTQIFDGLGAAGGKPQTQIGSTEADGVAPRFIASHRVSESTVVNAGLEGLPPRRHQRPAERQPVHPRPDHVRRPGGFRRDRLNYELGTKTTFRRPRLVQRLRVLHRHSRSQAVDGGHVLLAPRVQRSEGAHRGELESPRRRRTTPTPRSPRATAMRPCGPRSPRPI